MQMPWTTVESLTKDGNVPWEGADYPNFEMQKDVQEAFDEMAVQAVLAEMIHYGWEEFDQVIDWRIY